MADDMIEMDYDSIQRQFADINKKLTVIERDLRNNIMDNVLREAAGQLQAEQKRILSTAPSKGIRGLAADLSVWKSGKNKNSDKVSYRAGYSDDKIRQSIKYFVIEFGRPGKRHRNGIDKRGRRIGAIQPFPHIRKAWFLKKVSIKKYIAKRIDDEILERWNKLDG